MVQRWVIQSNHLSPLIFPVDESSIFLNWYESLVSWNLDSDSDTDIDSDSLEETWFLLLIVVWFVWWRRLGRRRSLRRLGRGGRDGVGRTAPIWTRRTGSARVTSEDLSDFSDSSSSCLSGHLIGSSWLFASDIRLIWCFARHVSVSFGHLKETWSDVWVTGKAR